MSTRKVMRKASRWILAFICSLSLFALLSLGVIKTTLFNQEFMISTANSADYSKTITEEINETIGDLGRGSNVPAEVLAETASQSLVKRNIERYIQSIYTELPFTVEGNAQIQQTIQTNIETYAKEKGYSITSETQGAIDRLKQSAADSFSQYIEIPYILNYGKKVMGYSKTLTLIMIFTGAVFFLLLAAIVSLTGRFWHRAIRYFAYVFGGAGLMLLVLPLFVYFSRKIDHLGIRSKSLYDFLTTYLNEFVLTFIKWGITAVVVGVVLWLISELVRKRKFTRRI
ncbi:hypothetical protein [Enterococcus sp. ZJ1668]|uniref:hypothetical protein n=1 Tax=Enterococcus sp. ZJ1668 TaxID=2709402 RepID=UPI0013EA8ABB|nr:hypothetical protein [Enterococcus sp. ZJ1668]